MSGITPYQQEMQTVQEHITSFDEYAENTSYERLQEFKENIAGLFAEINEKFPIEMLGQNDQRILQMIPRDIQELGNKVDKLEKLNQDITTIEEHINAATKVSNLFEVKQSLGQLVGISTFYNNRITALQIDIECKESRLGFLETNRNGLILGNINQFDGLGSKNPCTACATAFLAKALPLHSMLAIGTSLVDQSVMDGKKAFLEICDERSKEKEIVLQSLVDDDTTDLDIVGVGSEHIGWPDIDLSTHFTHLEQLDNPLQVIIQEDEKQYEEILSALSDRQKSLSKPLGAVFTAREKTYSLILSSDGVTIFDSHGNRSATETGEAFAWRFPQLTDAAKFLSMMIPFESGYMLSEDENAVIFYPVISKISLDADEGDGEFEAKVICLPKSEFEEYEKQVLGKSEIEQLITLKKMIKIRKNEYFDQKWLDENIINFVGKLPAETSERTYRTIEKYFSTCAQETVTGRDKFLENPTAHRIEEVINHLIIQSEFDAAQRNYIFEQEDRQKWLACLLETAETPLLKKGDILRTIATLPEARKYIGLDSPIAMKLFLIEEDLTALYTLYGSDGFVALYRQFPSFLSSRPIYSPMHAAMTILSMFFYDRTVEEYPENKLKEEIFAFFQSLTQFDETFRIPVLKKFHENLKNEEAEALSELKKNPLNMEFGEALFQVVSEMGKVTLQDICDANGNRLKLEKFTSFFLDVNHEVKDVENAIAALPPELSDAFLKLTGPEMDPAKYLQVAVTLISLFPLEVEL